MLEILIIAKISNQTVIYSAILSKDFFEEKVKLTVNAGDIFQTNIQNISVEQAKVNTDFRQLSASRFINFRVTYRFGGGRRDNTKSPDVEEENRI